MEDTLQSQARHMCEVEGLGLTQTARALGISRKKVTRMIRQDDLKRKAPEGIVKPYERLINEWYRERPFLQAIQVLERLRQYGYKGGYTAIKLYTQQFRLKRKKEAFHELELLPGEEAQVDWMQWTMPFGIVFGFVYLLAYSRYLYAKFYHRNSMEFFLDGHINAFTEIKGVPKRHRYDNLKSVILKRKPETVYNARFLDFARHYGFGIHPCTPGRANEKGRVERVIRDIESFIKATDFKDITDLNRKFSLWRQSRNNRQHRTTENIPARMLAEEKLTPLPQIPYKPYRHEPALISKTGFITLDTNRYSVPSSYCGRACDLFIYPEHIDIFVDKVKIAGHARVFERKQKIEHPGHRQKLLQRTPNFKYQRIYQLIKGMHKELELFLKRAEQEDQDLLAVSYELFKLLRKTAKETLISAVKEANSMKISKVTYIQSLLQPGQHPDNPVQPQDPSLLHINYEGRDLSDYDTLI
jgi:transposase